MREDRFNSRWLVWGHGNYWTVVEVNGGGEVQWQSGWFRTRDIAEIFADQLRRARQLSHADRRAVGTADRKRS